MEIHDLSVPIVDGTDWYGDPQTPPVRVTDIGDLVRESWVSHVVELAPLNGTTYIETSGHLLRDGLLLDDIPPERLVCRAHVLSCPTQGQEILPPEHPPHDFRKAEDAVLLHCGWDTHFGSPDYYHASPYFGPALCEWLLARDPSILGGDMLSFDHPGDASMPFLRAYFEGGGIIICPLQGLAPLGGMTATLCAAPLKLARANCAPCRVFAWQPDGAQP